MAWTTPITWGTATVTVAQMNEQVRDNMNYLNNLNPQAFFAGGRLTPTSANPYGTGDVADVSTVYYTPANGNRIALYDGASAWDVITFTEGTIDVTALTASKPYDVFCYNSGGTATLETLVWTNDTTRATGLTQQDGVLVKSGATTRRYLGCIYVDAGTVTQDSNTARYISNHYNAIPKSMYIEGTTENTIGTTAAALWNATTTNNQLDFIVGPPYGDYAEIGLMSRSKAGVDGNYARTQIHIDTVEYVTPEINVSTYINQYMKLSDRAPCKIDTGRHYVNAYVYGTNGGTATYARLRINVQVWV